MPSAPRQLLAVGVRNHQVWTGTTAAVCGQMCDQKERRRRRTEACAARSDIRGTGQMFGHLQWREDGC